MKKSTVILAILITGALSAQTFEPVPFDKKYHIGAGTLAGVWGTFAGNSLQWSPEESALFGIAMSGVAGIGKECMDVSERWAFKTPGARFDCMDIAATVEGGIIGAGLSYVALKIFKRKPPVIYADTNKGIKIGVGIWF